MNHFGVYLLAAGGWFISNPDTLCSASGGNFPYPGGLPLTPHHGYKHYPGLHGHRAAPYPSPYLPRHHHHHGHNSGDLTECSLIMSIITDNHAFLYKDRVSQMEAHEGNAGGLYADEKLIINKTEFLVHGKGCFSQTLFQHVL